MLKLKTNRSAVKRFVPVAGGGFKHRCALHNHILTKKSSKRKARLARGAHIDQSDLAKVKRMFRLV